MSTLCSIATGNLTSASTWALIDPTSYVNASDSTSATVPTSYADAQKSTTITPGAITIDAIALKVGSRNGTTGTLSAVLRNMTAGSDVAGTEVTINMSDVPTAAFADQNGGWIVFKFSAPVTLAGATNYAIRVKTSTSSQLTVTGTAASTLNAFYRTTTTQAPVAGDDLIVVGERTGAGTGNSFVVTMDETASTDYGSASTSIISPALAICDRGTLQYGTSGSTNYLFKISGNIIVYSGGLFYMGTSGTPMPRTSTASLNFDCGTNVDFGLIVRNLGTWNAFGLSRTSGKDIYYCKLNTDEAVNSTSLGVDTDTGWLDNDQIAIATTTRTNSECELGTLNGNAGASSLTVDGFAGAGGGLANAHSGTSPTQAEIILLTRNVKVFGASASLQAYINIFETADVECTWVEFYWLGSSTTGKRGIDIATTTGGAYFYYCSRHTSTVTSSRGWNTTSTSGSGIEISYCVSYNIAGAHYINVATTGYPVYIGNIGIRCTDSASIFDINDAGGDFIDNTGVGAVLQGVTFGETRGLVSTFTGNVAHGNNGRGFSISNIADSLIENCTSWRNNGGGFIVTETTTTVFDTGVSFGNASSNFGPFTAMQGCTVIDYAFNGDTSFTSTLGITFAASGNYHKITFINCDFGVAGGIKNAHSTADISVSAQRTYLEILLINCRLASSTEVTGMENSFGGFISSQKHDQTAGLHKTWKRFGLITIDTSIYNTASPSERLAPAVGSGKLLSGSKKVPVRSGNSVTINAYTRRSSAGDGVAYNGNQPRLMLKRNDALGITADTVIDTHSSADGSWELLTGTTSSVTDDGVLEFYVDCDGTAGWINVDDWSVS